MGAPSRRHPGRLVIWNPLVDCMLLLCESGMGCTVSILDDMIGVIGIAVADCVSNELKERVQSQEI